MHRTRIYLSTQDEQLLDELARSSGRTRSQLIRDAIARIYLAGRDHDSVLAALTASAGSWRGRAGGRSYVERLRRGRLARLHEAAR